MKDLNKLDGYFVQVVEDKFTKDVAFSSEYKIGFEESLLYHFLPRASKRHLLMYPYYFKTADKKDDLMTFNFVFINSDGGFSGLNGIKVFFLLDGDKTFESSSVLSTESFTRFDEQNRTEYVEYVMLQLGIANFISIVNAKKVEYRITLNGARLEGELSEWELVVLQGFYNNVFDNDFMRDKLRANLSKANLK